MQPTHPLDVIRSTTGLPDPTGTPVALPTPVPAAPLRDIFHVPPGVDSRLAPTDRFHVVDISTRDPSLPEDDWILDVHGVVEQESRLTCVDLLALPATADRREPLPDGMTGLHSVTLTVCCALPRR
jgi:hypothetical protein